MTAGKISGGPMARVHSVDILRGLVMIIMALDHVRDFLYPIQFDPADVTQTYPALFFTRWITHFCAPVFVLLAGTSAFLWENIKGKSKKQISWLFLSRGLWLMAVEILIINPLWNFNLEPVNFFLQVIWVIGLSMVVMAALVFLPWRVILGISLVTIFAHNTFDGITFANETLNNFWVLLHISGPLYLDGQFFTWSAYPLIPWFAVMGMGYCLGKVFLMDCEARTKFLVKTGLASIGLFIFLRALDFYGDPKGWGEQDNFIFTLMSFLNTEKYPPSLLFLLMTLGPAMLLLAWLEKAKGKWTEAVSVYGKVPFFFYILHIFLAHLSALILGVLMGYSARQFMFGFWAFPEGFGFGLTGAYLGTIIIVTLLYPLCRCYVGLKKRSKNPLLTYL